MATKLFLTNDDSVVFTPASYKGAWDSTASSPPTRRLHPSPVGGSTIFSGSDTSATNPFDRVLYRGVTDPLTAQTISGTLDAVLLMRETDAAANMTAHIHAWVTVGDSATVRGTLLTDYVDSQEFVVNASTFDAIVISPQTLSSVSVQAGDRIVVEIGYAAANAVTTSYTGALKYGGDTAAVGTETGIAAGGSENAWINFSGTLTFQPTYLYTTNDAAPVTPGATRGTYNDAGSAVDKYLAQSKAGTSTAQAVGETVATNPWDVLNVRFVTDQIAAQTLSGEINVAARHVESTSVADAFQKIHAYVMAPDGSVRGTLVSNSVNASELSSLSEGVYTYTMSSVAASDGDRIVIEVGARFTNIDTTSRSTTVRTGGTGLDSSAGQTPTNTSVSGWVRFLAGLTFYTAPPAGYAHSQVVIAG